MHRRYFAFASVLRGHGWCNAPSCADPLRQKAAALIKDPAAFEVSGATGVYSITAFRRNATGTSPERILTRLGKPSFIAVDPGACYNEKACFTARMLMRRLTIDAAPFRDDGAYRRSLDGDCCQLRCEGRARTQNLAPMCAIRSLDTSSCALLSVTPTGRALDRVAGPRRCATQSRARWP